ncbi:hypothetical protein L226DRAFT_558950 [Lentinus tigrinus ALCF2SS1-7]|uniref:F-box domain-containing protein n=1 Tax=Lentinus tigrinus ALCF2SS1-6 TaxID=1328759 RepID=A0A5C2SGG1_9APHY|nr:hypothetical protein L227DRAFT_573492 [Lentinus tigrinus ALCF2SS1-6]RPD77936.1 hypothetical protein L226DRAFT_558950 [Lentinus tigrinus ALCF2SS1-7]
MRARISTVADQQWKYAFQFSLPIQAVAPLSRDPNLLPLAVADVQPSVSDAAQQRPSRPPTNRLTTVNLDVQSLIMSLLPTADLSALMRTCRYFLDTGLLALCARIPERVLKHGAGVASFYEFLRSHSGPLSRTHLITDLRFHLPYEPLHYRGTQSKAERAEHINALLGILRSCRNLRRLRIDGWLKALPASLLLHTLATSLEELEELTLAITGRRDVEEKDLRKLGRLPKIRSIAIQASSATGIQALQPIARVLVELDRIHLHEFGPTLQFANVQKLGVSADRDPAWLENITTTFPNVSKLVLRPRVETLVQHRCYNDAGRAEDDSLRDYNRLQWRSARAKAWQSLETIWTHDLCGLYCVGVPRRVHALSVPLERPQTTYLFPVILADTQPGFLELRVDLSRLSRSVQLDGLGLVDAPAGSVVRRLALSLDFVYQGYGCQEKPLLVALGRGLCALSLTHLLVRYRIGVGPLSPPDAAAVAARAPDYATLLARSSPSLRWIGFDICGRGLLSWEVSRPSGDGMASSTVDKTPMLTQRSEWMGRRVLEAEGMDVFTTDQP